MRWLPILLLCWTCVGAVPAARAAEAAEGSKAVATDATVSLHNRRIVELRAALGDESPVQRASRARAAIESAAAGRGAVTRSSIGTAVRLDIDGAPMFFLVPEDLGHDSPGALFEAGVQKVQARLVQALAEAREMRDPQQLARAAAQSGVATVLMAAAAWLLLRGRRAAVHALAGWAERSQAGQVNGKLAASLGRHLRAALGVLGTVVLWVVLLLLLELWLSFVLQQFAYTRPWGEASSEWLVGLLGRLALGAVSAVPGLLTAALIFVLARLATRANGAFLQQVERGDLRLGWVDADTAVPTRRVVNLLIWLFALAIAYPHLPGAQSDSFKGVSVLAGLMLSLGASGIVGQAMAGLTLMFSRALRVGEYVRIGETEGTVTALGTFATKIQTGMGEEVSLPNAYVAAQAVRNFSRLVPDGQFVLSTVVTIGYATPWRQVHEMLLEAARRTPGVARDPAPYVMQTALSDFYVEYRLCAHGDRGAPRRRAEAINQLHGHIQDVFAENGVQIMSPHYLADPARPQVPPRP